MTPRTALKVLGIASFGFLLLLAALGSVTDTVASATINSSTDASATSFGVADIPIDTTWWLDTTAEDTLFTDAACTTAAAPGDDVLCWKDRVTSNTLTGTRPATYATTAINGHKPLTFVYLDSLIGPDLFSGSTDDIEIFFVSREIARTGNHLVSLNGEIAGDARFIFHAPWTNGLAYFDGGNLGGDRAQSTTELVPLGQVTLYNGRKDAAAGHNYLTVSNSATTYQSTANTAADTTGGLRVGARYLGNSVNHDLAEVIVYDRALSAADRADVTAYLMSKWSIPAIP